MQLHVLILEGVGSNRIIYQGKYFIPNNELKRFEGYLNFDADIATKGIIIIIIIINRCRFNECALLHSHRVHNELSS